MSCEPDGSFREENYADWSEFSEVNAPGFEPVTGEHACHEDFAYAASRYVVKSCEFKDTSPDRYEYFRDTMFAGREYLPEGGCSGIVPGP